jgi:anti-anti-sigma regulatory factor
VVAWRVSGYPANVRLSAVLNTVRDLGVHDHAGWVFNDPAEFRVDAARYLAAGLSTGHRVMYVSGDRGVGLPELAGLDAALATGQASISAVSTMYAATEPVDPQRQVAAFAEAARNALADGWAGLRVVADATSLVRTPQQHAAWIQYEYLIDRCIAHLPLSGLCGFNRSVLTDTDALTEVVCMHPALTPGASDFRLYGGGDGADVSIALAGEIDQGNRHLFASALRQARPARIGDVFVVDAARLTFMDYRSLAALARQASETGLTTMVYAAQGSVVTTLLDAFPIPGLQVRFR